MRSCDIICRELTYILHEGLCKLFLEKFIQSRYNTLFSLPSTEDLADTDATPTSTNLGFLGASVEGSADQREHLLPRGVGGAGGGGGGGGGGSSGLSALDQELEDSLQPLPMRRARNRRLITAPSDDTDSAVSMVSGPLPVASCPLGWVPLGNGKRV